MKFHTHIRIYTILHVKFHMKYWFRYEMKFLINLEASFVMSHETSHAIACDISCEISYEIIVIIFKLPSKLHWDFCYYKEISCEKIISCRNRQFTSIFTCNIWLDGAPGPPYDDDTVEFPSQRVSNMGLLCFLCSQPEESVEHTVDLPVI